MDRRRLTGEFPLEMSPVETLCGIVRGFARTPFVARLGLNGMAALASAMLSARGDLDELEAALLRFFGRDLPAALAAIDELIRALENQAWDPFMRAASDPDADWGGAREAFAGRLHRVRDRLRCRQPLPIVVRALPR